MNRYQPARLFTVEEANAMLPLVRSITGDLVRLSRELIERRQRLAFLTAGRDIKSGDPYGDELTQVSEQLERDAEKLQEYASELSDLGVELKSAPDGLVDFPSQMDERIVYLCWKHNEPEVLFWHELDTGFGGRQPLTADACSHSDGADHQGLHG